MDYEDFNVNPDSKRPRYPTQNELMHNEIMNWAENANLSTEVDTEPCSEPAGWPTGGQSCTGAKPKAKKKALESCRICGTINQEVGTLIIYSDKWFGFVQNFLPNDIRNYEI